MENYKIITNQNKLEEFITLLPECSNIEQYYITLLARKKYSPDMKTGEIQLKRFTSKKENIVDKIRQLECSVGSYKDKGISIPNEALALYITINPRDLRKASLNLIVTLAQKERDRQYHYNPQSLALTEIHSSQGSRVYYDIDIDESDPVRLEQTIAKIKTFINEDCLSLLKTRGGIHCLVKLNAVSFDYRNTWFKNIKLLQNVDVCGDNLIPIPGCNQGGFTPYFI